MINLNGKETLEQRIIREARDFGLFLTLQYGDKQVLCFVDASGSDSVKLSIEGNKTFIEVFPVDEFNDIRRIGVQSLDTAFACMLTFISYRELVVRPTIKEL